MTMAPHAVARSEHVGVLDRIRSILPSLIPSEQRVATELVANAEDVMGLSAAALASRAGTSAATVSRASQSLGFSGYPHLRLLLAREVGARRADSSAENDSGDRGIVRFGFEKAAAALSAASDSMDFTTFEQAADLISGAHRFLVVANGGSSPVAQGFAVHFVSSERRCEFPVDAIIQRLTASGLRSGDVCMAISESGSNAVTIAAATEAKNAGAAVIGLTAYARNPLAELSDTTLVAGATYRWDHERIGGNGGCFIECVRVRSRTEV